MTTTANPQTSAQTSEAAAKKDVTKLQRAVVDGLEDVKAQDIQVFNTEHLSPLFERVIIATGSSNRQTKALAASVREAVREAGFTKPRTEGEENGEWIIVDCGHVVVHVMQPAIRQYYRLEEIWGDKPVRLKLAAVKPRKVTASEDASASAAPKKTAAKKAPAKKAAVKTTAAKTTATKTTAAKKTATKTATKTAVKTAEKSAVKPAAKKTSAKTPAKKTPVQTLVVNAPEAQKAAVKKAPTQKAAAKKTPAKKTPAKKTPAKKASANKA